MRRLPLVPSDNEPFRDDHSHCLLLLFHIYILSCPCRGPFVQPGGLLLRVAATATIFFAWKQMYIATTSHVFMFLHNLMVVYKKKTVFESV